MNQSTLQEEHSLQEQEEPIVLKVQSSIISGEEKPYQLPLEKSVFEKEKLIHSSSKSVDSLDSGVYAREKSFDSMDSLNSENSLNGEAAAYSGLSPSDEAIPPLPTQQYEDYLRECQDIRQSIVVRSTDEEKQNISRTDSGEEHDDDAEAEWFRMAGLSDLVMTSSNTMLTSTHGEVPPPTGSDNLSSMTVLSTLTRPQREAVLRRISSFNRAQKTKRRSKPSIASIFPSVELTTVTISTDKDDECDGLIPDDKIEKPNELGLKSLSLPRESDDSEGGFSRRYSEMGRMRAPTMPTGSTIDLSDGAHLKPDYFSKQKKNVDAIVASSISGEQIQDDKCSKFSSIDSYKATEKPNANISSALLTLPCQPSSRSLPDLSLEPSVSVGEEDVNGRITSSVAPVRKSISSHDDVTLGSILDHKRSSGCEIAIVVDDSFILDSIQSQRLLQLRNHEDSLASTALWSKEDASFLPKRTKLKKSLSSSPNIKRHCLEIPKLFSSASSSLKSLRDPQSARMSMKSSEKRKKSASPVQRLSSFSSCRAPNGECSDNIITSDCDDPMQRSHSLRIQRKLTEASVSTTSRRIETLSINPKSFPDGQYQENKDAASVLADGLGKDKKMSYTEAAKEESLPNFSLVKDRLGITKISDLHRIDMRKVQSLAIIELTALFDLRNLDLKRKKLGKYKLKETGVFGIPLTTLVEWDRKRTNNPELRVPIVLSEIISFLEKNALEGEGILRKSGSAARIKLLQQDIDAKFSINVTMSSSISDSEMWKDARPNDVAALLKQFLRELPDPLLTTQFIDAFQSCSAISDRKEQLQALNLLILLLNDVHRDSLKLLLKFLHLVVANEEHNKMSLNNVAMITAPNLFISGRKGKKDTNTSQDLKLAAGTSNIVRMLIKYHKLLWTVPAFMLSQVRVMNGAQLVSKKHHSTSKEKYKKFFQGGRSKDKKTSHSIGQPFDFETPKGLIRVQGPNMKLTSIAVQLDGKLTAGDVIFKYHRQCERMNLKPSEVRSEVDDPNLALFEVGGNIHERCLDPQTNMSAVLKVNPEATWQIKPPIDS